MWAILAVVKNHPRLQRLETAVCGLIAAWLEFDWQAIIRGVAYYDYVVGRLSFLPSCSSCSNNSLIWLIPRTWIKGIEHIAALTLPSMYNIPKAPKKHLQTSLGASMSWGKTLSLAGCHGHEGSSGFWTGLASGLGTKIFETGCHGCFFAKHSPLTQQNRVFLVDFGWFW